MTDDLKADMNLSPETGQDWTRRKTLAVGVAGIAGLALSSIAGTSARAAGHAQPVAELATMSGSINIVPIRHASLALIHADKTMIFDPVGSPDLFAQLPPANLILITHEHGDHFDPVLLEAISNPNCRFIANPRVHQQLPAALAERTTSLSNGDQTAPESLITDLQIEAVPAYNITEGRTNYHPPGRDNGYVLTIDGARIYVAGDTEATSEFGDQADIDLAFVPMVLPFTMSVEQAAAGVLAIAPKQVYPYHYGGSDIEKFKSLVDAGGKNISVNLLDWYA